MCFYNHRESSSSHFFVTCPHFCSWKSHSLIPQSSLFNFTPFCTTHHYFPDLLAYPLLWSMSSVYQFVITKKSPTTPTIAEMSPTLSSDEICQWSEVFCDDKMHVHASPEWGWEKLSIINCFGHPRQNLKGCECLWCKISVLTPIAILGEWLLWNLLQGEGYC